MPISAFNRRLGWIAAGMIAGLCGCRTGDPLETFGHSLHAVKGDYFRRFDDFTDGVEIEKGHAHQALANEWQAYHQ